MGARLVEDKRVGQVESDALNAEMAAKREEKTLAAMDAIRELMKRKEVLTKEALLLDGACAVVEKAVAKLRRSVALGLDDWKHLHEEKVAVSDYMIQRFADEPALLERLRDGAELTLRDGALRFAGHKDGVEKLKEALARHEANFEMWLEGDEPTLKLFEERGEFESVAKKRGVQIGREGSWLWITGAQSSAKEAESFLKGLLSGSVDIDCPKKHVAGAKARAREVEPSTGAHIFVQGHGGWDGGGLIVVRGDEDCVEQAAEDMRAWVDEREGCTSKFVKEEFLAALASPVYQQLRADLHQFGGKFSVVAKARGTTVEVRGQAENIANSLKEMGELLDFYRKQV